MNNLPPAKRLLLFRTCRRETVLSRYTEKGNYRYYDLATATTINSIRGLHFTTLDFTAYACGALTRLRGCTWSEPFFRLAPLLHPHPCDYFPAGLSASDFLTLRSPIAQWVKRWSADLAVPSSIPARGGNLVSRKRWLDDLFNSISVIQDDERLVMKGCVQ